MVNVVYSRQTMDSASHIGASSSCFCPGVSQILFTNSRQEVVIPSSKEITYCYQGHECSIALEIGMLGRSVPYCFQLNQRNLQNQLSELLSQHLLRLLFLSQYFSPFTGLKNQFSKIVEQIFIRLSLWICPHLSVYITHTQLTGLPLLFFCQNPKH